MRAVVSLDSLDRAADMPLTPGPRVENDQFVAMLSRMVSRGLRRRLAEADPWDLPQVIELARLLDDVIVESMDTMNRNGFSHAEIGKPLGVTKQGVEQRIKRWRDRTGAR